MSGYNTILKIRRLEQDIDALGLRWGHAKHGSWSDGSYGNVVALYPKEDALPIYSRDAEIFIGTLDQLEVWLRGFQKAREYDLLLMGKKIETMRTRKEQDCRNKQLLMKIKESNQQGETA